MWKRKKKTEHLLLLPTERIFPNPWQARKNFGGEALTRLAQSIARYGMLEPLTVRRRGDDWELLIGERRLRAAKLLGMEQVPCRVTETNPRTGAELALIENLIREDLDFFEEAEAIDRLLKNFHYTQSELAGRIGQSQSAVANKLRLLRLSAEERILICENELSERHARALIRIPDPVLRLFALKQLIEKGYNVRQSEVFVESLLQEHEGERGMAALARVRPKPVRRLVVKDVRLFCNSVDRAIVGIREAGFALEAEKEEDAGWIRYSIRIPKYSKTG